MLPRLQADSKPGLMTVGLSPRLKLFLEQGQSKGTVVGLVLGTGIAGGVSIDGVLINNGDGQSGEFGHMPIPGTIITAHNLPILKCGCGRFGCYETYGSGPGLERLAKQLLGFDLTSHEIISDRTHQEISRIWENLVRYKRSPNLDHSDHYRS
jgi:predicted NBD/HSP70 family sugar kinase